VHEGEEGSVLQSVTAYECWTIESKQEGDNWSPILARPCLMVKEKKKGNGGRLKGPKGVQDSSLSYGKRGLDIERRRRERVNSKAGNE